MTNKMFAMVGFFLVLNLATGFMMNHIPVFQSNPIYTGGMYYNETASNPFVNNMRVGTNPQTVMTQTDNLFYRVLDMMNLGFIILIIESIGSYIYGVVNLFAIIFAYLLAPATFNFIFSYPLGVAYVMVDIAYVYGLWMLFTKDDVFN